MKRYYEAIGDVYSGDGNNTLFIAGGISNCPDWQTPTCKSIIAKTQNTILFNPRRSNYDVSDKSQAEHQIKWEFLHLHRAEAKMFWFPKETLCPITLYELGRWLTTSKKLWVGVHPEYQRKIDIEFQTSLERPNFKLFYDLDEMVEDICKNVEKQA